ncbi:unnamed protein product [Mucor circinelloides]
MPITLNSIQEITSVARSPAALELYGLALEYYECLLDIAITLLKTKKDEFTLELRLMEAIEHEFFSDLANVELVKPIKCFEEEEKTIDVTSERPEEHDNQVISSRIRVKKNCQPRFVDDKTEEIIAEFLANMNLKDVKSVDKENMEKMLSELFSTMILKDESFKDGSFKDDLMMDEVASALTELSLEVDSLETFDRDLAVFDRDGNIIVEEYCVYRFLTKVLLKANGGNESLSHVL